MADRTQNPDLAPASGEFGATPDTDEAERFLVERFGRLSDRVRRFLELRRAAERAGQLRSLEDVDRELRALGKSPLGGG